MQLIVKNVALVKDASVRLDGITVIAGKNGAGKSTIAKVLSSIISSNNKMDTDIRYQMENSIIRWLSDLNFNLRKRSNQKFFFSDIPRFLLRDGRQFADKVIEMYEGNSLTKDSLSDLVNTIFHVEADSFILDDESFSSLTQILAIPHLELVNYVAFKGFREKFGNQVNSYVNDNPAVISVILDNGKKTSVEFSDNKISYFIPFEGPAEKRLSVVFLESPNRLENSNADSDHLINPSLSDLLIKETSSNEIYEDYKRGEDALRKVDLFIQDIIHGKFVQDYDSRVLTFKDDSVSDGTIQLCNVASGVKVFAIIRRLVENRSISGNTILIVDEPETGLHPEWQVKFARLLGFISKEIGVKILLTTHSPYFLRALEVTSEKASFSDNVRYYIMSDYSALDVTDKTEVIYKELYEPLEEL